MSETLKSISFHGPDGCGKSTIAQIVSRRLSNDGHQVSLFGGSSFKEWLTPEIASRYLDDTDSFTSEPKSDQDRTRLYEDVAIVTYGRMNEIVEQGGIVVIDSDPYIKRQVWERIKKPDQDYYRYARQFEERMYAHVGNVFPGLVANIRLGSAPTSDVMTDRDALVSMWDRINGRGKVTDYDPESIEDAGKILTASMQVWSEIVSRERFLRSGASVIDVYNPDCPAGALSEQLERLADVVHARISVPIEMTA